MKTCIFLNGVIDDYSVIKEKIEKEDYSCIICADGGANHAYKLGIIPDYIIGDLDSVSPEIVEYYRENGVDFKELPEKKDETDSEICIYLAKTLGSDSIDIYSALGGRIDHTLANVKLLYYIKNYGIFPRIISENEIMYVIENERFVLSGNAGDTVSVIPIKGDAKGMTLEKLEYPLDNFDMEYAKPMGISNVMLEDECIIEIKDGAAVIVRNTVPVK